MGTRHWPLQKSCTDGNMNKNSDFAWSRWKRKKRKLNSQRQWYCRSDMHGHPKMSIPWANSIKITYSLSLHVWDLKRDGTHFCMMFRNWSKIVFCCCCCFWIPWTIFIGNLRQREQSQKSSAPLQMLQAGLQFGTDLAYLEGRRIKTKPHASRKIKKAGCGGEGEREQLVNMQSMLKQTRMENEGVVSIIFQNYFSTFSWAFGFYCYVDLTSHFLSYCAFKENHLYWQRWGTWLSILTSKSFSACNGKAPVEQHLDILFLAAVTKMKMPGERMP